jgi:hypothetical protein
MVSLLDEFKRGNIADKDRTQEDHAIRSHLGDLHTAWDRVFPRFPDCPWKRRTAIWEHRRGRRDAYLRSLIAANVSAHESERRLIVNPATVLGRHARALASQLPSFEVIGTDIEPRGERLYRVISLWKYPGLKNYRFVRENVYEPDLERRPAAVVFFGACGSVTDGSIDYAIVVRSPFLIFRSCCHDNIGGNTEVVKRPGFLNWFFRFKNYGFSESLRKKKGPYLHYFSDRYTKETYPRSATAREIIDSDTIRDVARNSVDSDICRSLIDLDRCMFLRESGYDVMYREELFFACRRPEA